MLRQHLQLQEYSNSFTYFTYFFNIYRKAISMCHWNTSSILLPVFLLMHFPSLNFSIHFKKYLKRRCRHAHIIDINVNKNGISSTIFYGISCSNEGKCLSKNFVICFDSHYMQCRMKS